MREKNALRNEGVGILVKMNRIPSCVLYALPLIAIFSIVLLAYWPGILVSDSMFQWNQTQTGQIDNWHPAYNTIYLMLLSRVCNSPAFVLFVQLIILSLSIGFFLSELEKHYSVNRVYLFVCAVLLALVPLNYNAAVLLLKDTIYAALSVVLCALTIEIINDADFFSSWKKLSTWSFVLLALCLTRHNGILAVVLYGLVLGIVFRKQIRLWVAFGCAIAFYLLLITVGFQILGVTQANYMNTYAPASHLVARMLNTESVEFSDDELEELSEFVDVEELKSTFNPINMDPSINSQNVDALKERGSEYLKLVFVKVAQYPSVALDHYLLLDSYLFSPMPFEGTTCIGTFYESDLWIYADEYPELEESSMIPALLKPLKKATKIFQGDELGVITLRPAWYLYLCIFFSVAMCVKLKNKKMLLIALVPVSTIISLAPAMPVPMVRYTYPVILVGYLTLVWMVYEVYSWSKSRVRRR